MADDVPGPYPEETGACAGCGRLPEQVDAMAGPGAGPLLCVDCVDRARAGGSVLRGSCAACGQPLGSGRPGAPVGDGGPLVCRPCLDHLAAAMAEPD